MPRAGTARGRAFSSWLPWKNVSCLRFDDDFKDAEAEAATHNGSLLDRPILGSANIPHMKTTFISLLSHQRLFLSALILTTLVPLAIVSAEPPVPPPLNGSETNARTFLTEGIVIEIKPADKSLVIQHGAISGYMGAMTMPFKVKEPREAAGLRPGDKISFRLNVTETESWIDRITKIGTAQLPPLPGIQETAPVQLARPEHPLLDCPFTNELGQAVTLRGFRGQALAITFFFTRCPLPEFCPRLSKNFEEASQKLAAMSGAPTNWHFISVSFDPVGDTPPVLKAYGEMYHYNPAHWSFLTGAPDKIRELARLSGVQLQRNGSLINHNFRTLIIDPHGHLQNTFPFGGDLSDMIVSEILKAAAAVTNQTMALK
jgi:protein SCO1/2